MPITIESVRRWLLVLAALLVAGIAGTYFYARYQVRRVTHDLPGKLGIDIQQSAKEFTFSKSEHGRTLFILRASKAVQYKGGGRVLLHDFAILLYGKDGRADRISGSEFEFDPALRLATANGEVHLDLHAPVPVSDAAKAPSQRIGPVHEDRETVHVLTHGLVFDQTSGDASTKNEIEFRFQQSAGTARGAEYDSERGLLELQSDVHVTSNNGGREFSVRAAHAAYRRGSRQLDLTAPQFYGEQQKAAAAYAVVQLSGEGRPQAVRATGGATLETENQIKATAASADADFNKRGRVTQIRLRGGVHSTQQRPDGATQSNADQALLTFDENGMVRHAAFAGAVKVDEASLAERGANQPAWQRNLKADRVDADFAVTQEGHSEARKLTATGNAALHIVQATKDGRAEDSTLSADQLTTALLGGKQISHLAGTGHARFARAVAGGPSQTSSSDSLAVDFTAASPQRGQSAISAAVERGNVIVTQGDPVGHPGDQQGAVTAYAQTAEYRSTAETVTLTGDTTSTPRLSNGTLNLSAQRIVLGRLSGDAVATGSLKATYFAGSNAAPLHVVADRGEMYRAQQRAVFIGHARLWQQESSIEAPVLEMERTGGRLNAHGDPGVADAVVHGVFVGNANSARQPVAVHISSRTLTYSDTGNIATFAGATVVEDGDARVSADQAVVTLRRPAASKVPAIKPQQTPGNATIPGVSGAVERIVSEGHVVLQEPARKGTGSKLVYTASDGRFVLTGTPTQPPQLSDAIRGTITGDSLIFLSRTDSVQVGNDAGGLTTTRTRVKK